MQDQAYFDLARSLARENVHCHLPSPGQLVISRQMGPVWPDRGNSFWVTHSGGAWHLFTWAPRGYRLPDSNRIADLCRVFMASSDRAAFAVPEQIIEEFELVILSDDEAELVYQAMPKT